MVSHKKVRMKGSASNAGAGLTPKGKIDRSSTESTKGRVEGKNNLRESMTSPLSMTSPHEQNSRKGSASNAGAGLTPKGGKGLDRQRK